jgi:hypothetical protein
MISLLHYSYYFNSSEYLPYSLRLYYYNAQGAKKVPFFSQWIRYAATNDEVWMERFLFT